SMTHISRNSLDAIRSRSPWLRLLAECIAELLDTTILVVFGYSGIAQYTLWRGTLSSCLSVNFAIGTDINPAVSISMLSLRSITPLQCITYIIACMHLKKTRHKTIVVTSLESTEALLLIAIYVLSNKRNKLVANAQVPIAVGFVIVAIGYNCGFPINPARDLAPRLFTPFVDYETEVFSVGNYYFWIPCIGPIFGRLAGTWIYYGYSKLMEKHIGEEDIETARIRNQIDSSSEARL
ncbi:unnamed protein product, partial [Rotaria magnacalcarata]